MISVREIQSKSQEWGVPTDVVDKDWVLGHFVNGVFANVTLKTSLVFKGGTCLRKMYFQNYRFSEDIDFTALNPLNLSEWTNELSAVAAEVSEKVGIRFEKMRREEERKYKDQLIGYRFHIPFWGANHPPSKRVPEQIRWRTRIQIEITLHEQFLLPGNQDQLFHPYSDTNLIDSDVLCYGLHEILAEKLHSILQRAYSAPRDYYDLWYISKFEGGNIDWQTVIDCFHSKRQLKKTRFKSSDDFFATDRLYKVRQHWEPSLKGHIKDLPDVEIVLKELKSQLQSNFRRNKR